MNDALNVLYFQVTDLWKRLCESHSELLDLTFDEYSLLLSSDIDALEDKIEEKKIVIERISGLEGLRADLIDKVNKYQDQREVKNVIDLINVMSTTDIEREQKHLFRFNTLLIDIIEKIQEQNKKNQLFINKALNSLKEIREGATGTKSYPTYDKKGATQARALK